MPRLRACARPLLKHTDARPESLSAAQVREWGSYYNNRPAAYSGDIRIGERAFRKLMATDPEPRDITRRAFRAGRIFANQGMHPDECDHTIT